MEVVTPVAALTAINQLEFKCPHQASRERTAHLWQIATRAQRVRRSRPDHEAFKIPGGTKTGADDHDAADHAELRLKLTKSDGDGKKDPLACRRPLWMFLYCILACYCLLESIAYVVR